MDFERIKVIVGDFLEYSGNEHPYYAIKAYFAGDLEGSRIDELELLLGFLKEELARPEMVEEESFCGYLNGSEFRMHYAYPLVLILLNIWVRSIYEKEVVKGLDYEGKYELYTRLKKGIDSWDQKGFRKDHYDELLNSLISS
ncbi:MAG: hypothetical protein PHW52_01590 [Candidatus Pacebacteria bacterium]|nr:hypothetical protein [Candidatus Paceibacterota bacterium]